MNRQIEHDPWALLKLNLSQMKEVKGSARDSQLQQPSDDPNQMDSNSDLSKKKRHPTTKQQEFIVKKKEMKELLKNLLQIIEMR